MKIALIVLGSLVALILLAVIGIGGLIAYQTREVSRLVTAFEAEFKPGTTTATLIDRAIEIGATSLILVPGDGLTILYDKRFPGDGRNKPEHLEEVRESVNKTANFKLMIAVPGFLNARWLIDVETEDHKIKSISSRYID